jgi:HD-GYP domain-containing protein (c-di-GMP phosphodiesterase class II)
MLLSEELVGEARERRVRRLSSRERFVNLASAVAFAVAATAIALLVPNERESSLFLIAIVFGSYVAVSRVRFEFGGGYVSAEQLLLVPAVVLLPLPLVPALVALAATLSLVPEMLDGGWHRDRWTASIADSWFSIGPVLVLAALAPGNASLDYAPIYALALAGQLIVDLAWVLVRNGLLDHVPLRNLVPEFFNATRVEIILSPVALIFSLQAANQPLVLLVTFPLVWLLDVFARDREARYAAALELQRAYRGTVSLLSDVVEFDDPYTAAHSRSIVELVEATAERMGLPHEDRRRLEFAALLHDVGKIAIPKEILNKPASLDEEEFRVMKTHTIEGQYMLDRVGGVLGEIGEIVRSCHERWDGQGYPDGIAGEDIPLEARIVFACDAYNAMTTDRVYRRALATDEATRELQENAGTQFDPVVIDALLEVVEHGEPLVVGSGEIRAILASNAPAAHRLSATT